MSRYVQYGCGLDAPLEWINYDASPTLRLQNTPILGSILNKWLNVRFPPNVLYGDIISGLPEKNNSCDGIYCSHTLEHLSLNDFRIAIRNSYSILKEKGIFRLVVPDLEYLARTYIENLGFEKSDASIQFLSESMLGLENRPKTLRQKISFLYGNSHHLWMWDFYSLANELNKAGFKNIKRCRFGDCNDVHFAFVERESRFTNALAIECIK